MNTSDSGPDFSSGHSCLRGLDKSLSSPPEDSGLRLSQSGHSVRMIDSTDSGCLWQQLTNQDVANCSLDSFLLSHLPSVENLLLTPELISQNDLDEIVPVCFADASEPVDNFASKDYASTGSRQITQPSLCSVESLIKCNQQQVLTETGNFKAIDSFVSGVPVPLALEEVPVSGMDSSNQSNYTKSVKDRARRARNNSRYAASDKGKKTKARYLRSDEGRARHSKWQAKYAATDKGKAVRARIQAKYAASNKGKAVMAKYLASDKYRLNRARRKVHVSDKTRMSRAIANARSIACRAALRKGFSEEEAKEQGKLAADKKRAEISLMSFLSPTHQ